MNTPAWVRDALLDAMPVRMRRQYLFKRDHGHYINFSNPRGFSEKIVWRMLYDHRSLLSWTCDKERMKREVVRLDPTVNVLPTIWYGDDVSELSRVDLPDEWVIKPNRQSSGRVHFGHGAPDLEFLAHLASRWLRAESRKISRKGEWAYSQARSGLLVEPRLKGPEPGAAPVDYKVFVFGGKPELIQVHYGRGGNHVQYHVTPEWIDYGIRTSLSSSKELPEAPIGLERMLTQAANIARDFDFMRVDFYEEDGQPFFGEVTPYPAGARRRYYPDEIELRLGALWQLPGFPR